MLEVEFFECSDRGLVRDHNEDYLGCVVPETPAQARTHGWLFALADGVGGQEHGEVASRVAVETLQDGFRRAAAGEPLAMLLPRLVQKANARVLDTGMAGAAAIATTIVTCALRFDRAVVSHAGDSRCYLVRRGQAALLTHDHTVANDQIRLGVLSAAEAASGAARHVLSRSLGSDLFVGVETSEHTLRPSDLLVLCSDGLHAAVDASEIAKIAGGSARLSSAAQELISLANQRDGSDNISVLLARIRDVERVGMYRGRPYKLY